MPLVIYGLGNLHTSVDKGDFKKPGTCQPVCFKNSNNYLIKDFRRTNVTSLKNGDFHTSNLQISTIHNFEYV